MGTFQLHKFDSLSTPRWPGLPADDALALLGYCLGRREGIRRRCRVVREVFDTYRDMMLAIYCCGGSSRDVVTAINDYSDLMLDPEIRRRCFEKHPRQFAVYLEESLLTVLQSNGNAARLEDLVEVACAALSVSSHWDAFQLTRLEVLCRLITSEKMPMGGIQNTSLSGWLRPIAVGDDQQFRKALVLELEIIRDNFAFAQRANELLFLERVSNFRRFGSGFITAGTIPLAKRAGMDCEAIEEEHVVKEFMLLE